MGTSEKTLYTALQLYGNPTFRTARAEQYPGSSAEYDARAAVFEAMDSEGRFDSTIGQPMTSEETTEFNQLAGAIIKMSGEV